MGQHWGYNARIGGLPFKDNEIVVTLSLSVPCVITCSDKGCPGVAWMDEMTDKTISYDTIICLRRLLRLRSRSKSAPCAKLNFET